MVIRFKKSQRPFNAQLLVLLVHGVFVLHLGGPFNENCFGFSDLLSMLSIKKIDNISVMLKLTLDHGDPPTANDYDVLRSPI